MSTAEAITIKLTSVELFDIGRAAERAGFESLTAFVAYALKTAAAAENAKLQEA